MAEEAQPKRRIVIAHVGTSLLANEAWDKPHVLRDAMQKACAAIKVLIEPPVGQDIPTELRSLDQLRKGHARQSLSRAEREIVVEIERLIEKRWDEVRKVQADAARYLTAELASIRALQLGSGD